MKKKRIGILVGHYGKGTGASYEDRDEFVLCADLAARLSVALLTEGKVNPLAIATNQAHRPWRLVQKVSRSSPPSFLGGWGNIDVRVEWAKEDALDLAVELHLNRFKVPLGRRAVSGFEVFVKRGARLASVDFARRLLIQFDKHLQTRNRGLKYKSFRVLRKLDAVVPVVLVEPAFLAEPGVGTPEWAQKVVTALKAAIYAQFNIQP